VGTTRRRLSTGPMVVAVTGGIASGKSAVTIRFEALGVQVLDADIVSRALVGPGEAALAEIAAHFGPQMLTQAGELDRAALRARIFAEPAERRALEKILHPRVRSALRDGVAAATSPYVMIAIPLLAESGDYGWVDRVLVVDAPVELQLRRVMQRDGIDRAAAQRILDAQAGRHERLALADDVVINDAGMDQLDRVVPVLDRLYRRVPATVPRGGEPS